MSTAANWVGDKPMSAGSGFDKNNSANTNSILFDHSVVTSYPAAQLTWSGAGYGVSSLNFDMGSSNLAVGGSSGGYALYLNGDGTANPTLLSASAGSSGLYDFSAGSTSKVIFNTSGTIHVGNTDGIVQATGVWYAPAVTLTKTGPGTWILTSGVALSANTSYVISEGAVGLTSRGWGSSTANVTLGSSSHSVTLFAAGNISSAKPGANYTLANDIIYGAVPTNVTTKLGIVNTAVYLTGNNLTLTGDRTLYQNNPLDSSLDGTIAESGGSYKFIKSGAYRLFNNAIATNTGGIDVAQGLMSVMSDRGLGSNDINVYGGGSLGMQMPTAGNSGSAGVVTLTDGTITGSTKTLTATGFVLKKGTIDTMLKGNTAAVGISKTTSAKVVVKWIQAYTGLTDVQDGELEVATGASLANSNRVAVAAGATLSGKGTVSMVSGAGRVSPGDSASNGLLRAASLDPSAGTDFSFELAGALPYQDLSVVNDLLYLTGTTPLAASLTSANETNVYLSATSVSQGSTFRGGFYAASDLLGSIADTKINAYVQDVNGAIAFNGKTYTDLASLGLGLSISTAPLIAATGAPVDGYVSQFTVVAVPEPATTMACLGVVGGVALLTRRRSRA